MNELVNDPVYQATSLAVEFDQKPLGFIDVGARGGVSPMMEPIASSVAVLGFEPDPAECDRLRNELSDNKDWRRCEIEMTAIADREGSATVHLYSVASNNSLLPPNEAITRRYAMEKFRATGRATVQTKTLDQIVFSDRHSETFWGEILKLDTQATEFEILQGAKRLLSQRTLAVVAEVWFAEVYKGQHLFSDVEALLRGHGFRFYGFSSMFTRSRKQIDKRTNAGRERLLYADAIFLKDPFDADFQPSSLPVRQAKVLFIAALLNEYYDFALEIALATWATGSEESAIRRLIDHAAHLPPEQSARDAALLAQRVRENPDRANVEVGRFVDERRERWDYRDVQDS